MGELSMRQRLGTSERSILAVQSNLAMTYGQLGLNERALQMNRDVYSGRLKLHGEEHKDTPQAATNYASSLGRFKRFEEAKSLLRKMMPVARRALGDGSVVSLTMNKLYATVLCADPGTPLDDFRDAVNTLEDAERTARRVLGGAHPTTTVIAGYLRKARVALGSREAPVQEKLAQECSEIAETLADTTLGEEETPPDNA